jgi:hypothetical protein
MVDTLSSPGFASLPHQLGEFMQTIGDVSRRLAPLTQLAENAGGLFGGFKLPGIPGRPAGSPGGRATPPTSAGSGSSAEPSPRTGAPKPAAPATTTARRSTAKKTTAKKTTAKKSTTKTTAAKRSTAKKSSS